MPALLADLKRLDLRLDRQEKRFNKTLESRYNKLESISLRQASQYKHSKDFIIPTSNITGLESAFKQHFKEVTNISVGHTRRELLNLVNNQEERDKILSLTAGKNNKSNQIYAQKLAKKQIEDYENKVKSRINQALELNPKLSTEEIKKIIRDETLSFKNVRLAATSETESNRVANEVKLEIYKKAGIKEKKFTAILDNRTSNYCKEHNGKVYKINETSISIPAHIRCRSYWIANK